MAIQSRSKRVSRIQNGLSVRTDCFAYNKDKKECSVMTELICLNRKCSFYKPEGCDKNEKI